MYKPSFTVLKAFILSLSFCLLLHSAHAQDTAPKEKSASTTLTQEFSTLKKANSYQGHKVIEIGKLDAFYNTMQQAITASEKSLRQSLTATEQDLATAKTEIQALHNQVEQLKQVNAQKEQEVQKSAHDIANLSVLGIDMEKQNYVLLSFAVIIALILIMAVTIMQFRSAKKVAVDKQKAFDKIDEEYNEYKKTVREKETKLKRELQTEFNRAEELSLQVSTLKKMPVNKSGY
jgi:hypothetical protein